MSPEELRILEMLSQGKLTPQQADRLLQAIADVLPPAIAAAPTPRPGPEAMVGEVLSAAPRPPDLDRYRRLWRIPFLVALTLLLFFAVLFAGVVTRNSEVTFGVICLLGFVLLAAGGLALAWWSRSAPWIHIRVQSQTGSRVRISFPFAPGLARWTLAFGRRFVDGDARAGLDTAAAMIEAVANNIQTTGEPLTLAVDDQVDGEKVLVYVG